MNGVWTQMFGIEKFDVGRVVVSAGKTSEKDRFR